MQDITRKHDGTRSKRFENINTAVYHRLETTAPEDDIAVPSFVLGLLAGVSMGVVFTIIAFLWALTD